MKKTFIIATVGSPFGLDGFVKIRSLSGEIDHFLELDEVTVLKNGEEQILKIEEIKESPLAMRFAGIDTPEKAKPLAGAEIIADRDRAAPLNEGEFYIEDLKGLEVVTTEGQSLGIIADIIEGGGGELVEISMSSEQGAVNSEKKAESKGQSLKLVPFRKEFFSEISPEKGKVVMQNLWILE